LYRMKKAKELYIKMDKNNMESDFLKDVVHQYLKK